jgi:hypothetical protein
LLSVFILLLLRILAPAVIVIEMEDGSFWRMPDEKTAAVRITSAARGRGDAFSNRKIC